LGFKDQVIAEGTFSQFVNMVPADIDLEPVEIIGQKKPNLFLIVGGTALAVWALTSFFKQKPQKVKING
jgi:hypothetical protein